MNFLNQHLLTWMVPLLAVPLAIHLLNRRFPKQIRFPDITRLKKSLTERSKLAKWRHIIMTALRTILLALALLAFLKPVLPKLGSEKAAASTKGRKILLVLDRSLSMNHQEGGKTPAARNAVIEAGKILETLEPADAANAILVGANAQQLLSSWTKTHDQIRSSLATLPISYEKADFTRAITLVNSMLGAEATGAEVYFLSDFQRANFSDVAFETLPKGCRVFFVDSASDAPERSNRAILKVTPTTSVVAGRDNVKLDVTLGNYSAEPVELVLEAVVDNRSSVTKPVKIPAWSTASADLEFATPGAGIHQVELKIPEDGMPTDNHYWLALRGRDRETVLVLSDVADAESGAEFIRAALDPYDSAAGAYAVVSTTTNRLTPAQLASASKLVFTGVSALPPDLVTRVNGFLEKGGGLIYFLDGKADQANLQAMDQEAGRPSIPFYLAGKLSTENFGGKPQQIGKGKFDSPFLRLFRGTNRQALALLEFYALQRSLPTSQGEILLSFVDGSPAMGSASVGLGTVLLCNFAAAELSSNLARQRLFPAWMHDLMRGLSVDGAIEGTHEVGTLITAELWARDVQENSIQGPDSQPVSFKSVPDNERLTASFVASIPGIYTLKNKVSLVWADCANASPEEADLRKIDTAELLRRTDASPAEAGHVILGAEDYRELKSGSPIYHWFLLGLAGFLLLEMLLIRPFQRSTGKST